MHGGGVVCVSGSVCQVSCAYRDLTSSVHAVLSEHAQFVYNLKHFF